LAGQREARCQICRNKGFSNAPFVTEDSNGFTTHTAYLSKL